MIHGIDTTFLVQIEARRHPGHQKARELFDQLLNKGDSFAIAPQVLAEFIHVVTDQKRFESPLTPPQAIDRAHVWWTAREVIQAFPDSGSTKLFFTWMMKHQLGRKRILDTQLAATYYQAGIRFILSSNARNYGIFDCFNVFGN